MLVIIHHLSMHMPLQTSDWTAENSVSMKELILVTGVTKDVNEETIRNAIPEDQRQYVSKVSSTSCFCYYSPIIFKLHETVWKFFEPSIKCLIY